MYGPLLEKGCHSAVAAEEARGAVPDATPGYEMAPRLLAVLAVSYWLVVDSKTAGDEFARRGTA